MRKIELYKDKMKNYIDTKNPEVDDFIFYLEEENINKRLDIICDITDQEIFVRDFKGHIEKIPKDLLNKLFFIKKRINRNW